MARLAKRGCKVIGTTHKAQSPAATGLSAYENTSTGIVSPKRETTLMARFAMKGADFAALVGFARQMGVI